MLVREVLDACPRLQANPPDLAPFAGRRFGKQMSHRTNEELIELTKRIVELGDTWKWVAELMMSFPEFAPPKLPVVGEG
jgi:hypothetical protein